MGEQLRRYHKRQDTLKRLRACDGKSETTLLIHYSCESFYDRKDGSTPRITSIAVRNLASGQTDSFSIHKAAELKRIPNDKISDQYDNLEKDMLTEFFVYLRMRLGHTWVHWKMRDINYGFQAIEHRFRVLGGDPGVSLLEQNKFDLARALISIYGDSYIGHQRLESIVKFNHISDKDFLNGQKEADAFDNCDYVKIHLSTLRKVDILANIFERTLQGTLKNKAKWHESHGLHPKILIEVVTEHWIFAILIISISLFGFFADFASLCDRFTQKNKQVQPIKQSSTMP